MKTYKLNITIRKGLEDVGFGTYILDTQHFQELFLLKKLLPFKDDAYLTVSLDEIIEEEKNINPYVKKQNRE